MSNFYRHLKAVAEVRGDGSARASKTLFKCAVIWRDNGKCLLTYIGHIRSAWTRSFLSYTILLLCYIDAHSPRLFAGIFVTTASLLRHFRCIHFVSSHSTLSLLSFRRSHNIVIVIIIIVNQKKNNQSKFIVVVFIYVYLCTWSVRELCVICRIYLICVVYAFATHHRESERQTHTHSLTRKLKVSRP